MIDDLISTFAICFFIPVAIALKFMLRRILNDKKDN